MHNLGRKLVIVGFVVLVGLTIYSLLGVLQTTMLSGDPNYGNARAMHNVRVWGSISVISLIGAVVLLLKLRDKGQ